MERSIISGASKSCNNKQSVVVVFKKKSIHETENLIPDSNTPKGKRKIVTVEKLKSNFAILSVSKEEVGTR